MGIYDEEEMEKKVMQEWEGRDLETGNKKEYYSVGYTILTWWIRVDEELKP